jgi:hypothetical protein
MSPQPLKSQTVSSSLQGCRRSADH